MDEELEIGARSFVLCRGVTFDGAHRQAPYSLHQLLSTVSVVEAELLTLTKPIYAYVEYFGPAGDYEVWIDLVSLEYNELGEETEMTNYGPVSLRLPEGKFVHGRCYCLQHVPLLGTGLYEFRIQVAGQYHPIIHQSLFLEE